MLSQRLQEIFQAIQANLSIFRDIPLLIDGRLPPGIDGRIDGTLTDIPLREREVRDEIIAHKGDDEDEIVYASFMVI